MKFEFKELTSKSSPDALRVLTFEVASGYFSQRSVEGFDNKIWCYGQAAKIGTILKNTMKAQLKEFHAKLRHNEESKVDVGELRNRVATFAAKRLERKATDYFKINQVVKLNQPIQAGEYTQDGYGRVSHVMIMSGALKFNNHVILCTDTEKHSYYASDKIGDTGFYKQGETKFMKKERLLELLKDGEAIFE